jgi:hypothetical protein
MVNVASEFVTAWRGVRDDAIEYRELAARGCISREENLSGGIGYLKNINAVVESGRGGGRSRARSTIEIYRFLRWKNVEVHFAAVGQRREYCT